MSLEAKAKAFTTALIDLMTEIAASGGESPAKTTSKPASGKPASGKAAGGKKGAEITVDTVAEKFGNYLNTGSAAAKKKAKIVVKGIIEHFEAERISKIDPDQFGEALKLLKQYEDDEDPLDLFDEDGEDDDDDGMV